MEAKDLIEEIRVIQKYVDYRKSKLRGGYDYDFSDYKTFKELFKGLYYKKCTIDEAEREQDEVNAIIGVFEEYTPKNNKYIEAKNKILNKVKKNYEGREKIIERFKNGIFPFNYDKADEELMRFEREEEERLNNIKNKNGLLDYTKPNRLIDARTGDINNEFVRKHFLVQGLGSLLEKLRMSKNNSERNKIQVGLINSGLGDLKKAIEDMSEEETEIESPN